MVVQGVDGEFAPPITLPRGDDGVMITLRAMERVALDAAINDPTEYLTTVRGGMGARPVDVFETLSLLWTFERDPRGLDLLKHPTYTLRQWRRDYAGDARYLQRDPNGRMLGDCDDRATFGAALCLVLGMPCGFKVIGQRADGPYQHVYLVIQGRDGWIAVDPQEASSLGAEAPHARGAVYRINKFY